MVSQRRFRTGLSEFSILGAGFALIGLLAPPAGAFDPLRGDYAKGDPLDIRIVAYNHHGNFITDPTRDAAFDRVLVALSPDLICFEEFPDSVTAGEVADRLDRILPISGGSWQIHLGRLGGTRTVLASRFPLTMTAVDTIPPSATRGVTLALADLPDADYREDVYLLGVHLKCCGDPGGSEDASRQTSADAIANWLGDARDAVRPAGDNIALPAGTPMIVLGDFNLVGGPQPESTLLTGDIQQETTYGADVKGDWDDTGLTDLNPLDPFTGDNFTWQGSGSFPPSALDRIIYTDSVVTVADSFVLNTATMTPAALTAAGLQAGDTLPDSTSDHLPIVMDLRLAAPGCTGDADCDDGVFCNGVETCDAVLGCQAGTAPCPDSCDESTDTCPDQEASEPLRRDSDLDGVNDAYDECPDTPAGAAVDAGGCPLAAQESPQALPTSTAPCGATGAAALTLMLAGLGLRKCLRRS